MKSKFPRSITLAVLVGLGLEGSAAAFTPIQPPNCATGWDVLDFAVSTRDSDELITPVLQSTRCNGSPTYPCPHYANKVDYSMYFIGNAWTTREAVLFDSFNTEANFDFVKGGADTFPEWTMTGDLAAQWQVLGTSGAQAFHAKRGLMQLTTDQSVTRPGFKISKLAVCSELSSPSTESPGPIAPSRRHVGALLGTGDVVHGYLLPPPDSGAHQTVMLWSPDPVDFDLYVRCGEPPTIDQFDWRAFSANAQEFLDIGAGCGPQGQLAFVAIRSFSGRGTFSLLTHGHRSTQHIELRVGGDATVAAADWDTIVTVVRNGTRSLFGNTDGNLLTTSTQLYRQSSNCDDCGGRACDMCFHKRQPNETGLPGGTAPLCQPGRIWIYGREVGWTAGIVRHEMGHRYYCAADEYYNGCGSDCSRPCNHPTCTTGCNAPNNLACSQCGYTAMDSFINYYMCNQAVHTLDPEPMALPTSLPSARQQAHSAGVGTSFSSTAQADIYLWFTHDFNFVGEPIFMN